ncbi:MAG: tetratricopeptide repeat protein [Deltaproteobacteria bacterium]
MTGIQPLSAHAPTDGSVQERTFPICAPCARDQASKWAKRAASDMWSGLKAANCYAYLVAEQPDRASKLKDAQRGRKLAREMVARHPKSGLAHYLYAYLTGLEAENDPLHGLEWVPVIEREARLAADLNPGIDHGGPDRMLGELYLKAPAFPMSVGDPARSVAHFKKALEQAPEFKENRLGLVEALLADDKRDQACHELQKLWAQMRPNAEMTPPWEKALGLMEALCKQLEHHE